MTSASQSLLRVAFHHAINEANIEAGFERFAALTGAALDYTAFCDAVAECLRLGFIREPIRLPEGALQCHWHLELTPKGVEAARRAKQAVPSQPPDARIAGTDGAADNQQG